jgi:hypothetical protein
MSWTLEIRLRVRRELLSAELALSVLTTEETLVSDGVRPSEGMVEAGGREQISTLD